MKPEHSNTLDELLAPALKPSPEAAKGARARLLQRAEASRAAHQVFRSVRREATPWRELMPGVRSRELRSTAGGSSVLIALDPGRALPVHRHRYLEEGLVLTGGMQMGALDLGPGDYHVSFPGSRHDRITSAQGCITYLRGTSLGSMIGLAIELLGGWAPGAGDAPVTVTERDGSWRSVGEGVVEKVLWESEEGRSRFVRIAPGGYYCPPTYQRDGEFMVVAGEIFFGDILLRQEELHLAPAGSCHKEISSDCGGTFFIHEQGVLIPTRGRSP